MALIKYRDKPAEDMLGILDKFMDNKGDAEVGKSTEIKGFFRRDSYDWVAYHFYYNKEAKLYTLVTHENLQHEGYCKKYLDL